MKTSVAQKLETAVMPWDSTDVPGVERKRLASSEPRAYEVDILRLAPGASLPCRDGWGQEVVVLEGRLLLPEGELGAGGYSRRPAVHVGQGSAPTGCVLFVRASAFDDRDGELVHCPADDTAWVPGHGNLRVRSLHAFGTEGTAFVHWPAGERFVPHQHWGGEEIFVLSGTFEDEHGRYPTGTWILSPHLSGHHPLVREETVIFVKTGHVPA
jgi:anti-sigma factor ChrR (cupin superfamily)